MTKIKSLTTVKPISKFNELNKMSIDFKPKAPKNSSQNTFDVDALNSFFN
jgi:hypothetical protein